MARERPDGPRPIAASLRQLAARIRRVDLVGYAAVEAAWPAIDAARASGAVPQRYVDGELTVAVDDGARASRARRDAAAMLDQLRAQMADPPTRLRVTVRPPQR